jgi:hypothetical protein
MDNQAQLWIEAPRFQFFVYFSCRVGGLFYHDNKLDALAIFTYYVCIVLVMAALYIASLSGGMQNLVQAIFCNFLCKHYSSSKARAQKNMLVFEQYVATCSGFPPVAEQVATMCHCIAYNCY